MSSTSTPCAAPGPALRAALAGQTRLGRALVAALGLSLGACAAGRPPQAPKADAAPSDAAPAGVAQPAAQAKPRAEATAAVPGAPALPAALAGSRLAERLAEQASERRKRGGVTSPPLPRIEDRQSALERQLRAPWGWRADRDRQVRVPLADHGNWKRIRLGNVDHLTAFKYTDDYHLLTAAFAVPTPGSAPSSQACMVEFEKRGFREMQRRGVVLGPVQEQTVHWRKGDTPVVVHTTDGVATFFFKRYQFSVAWVTYPAYADGCLAYATLVQWDGEPELARAVLERWVEQGLRRMDTRTETLPFRH